ncbi:hypothetical protein DAETH_43050 (plasmid) [Deinococcus aetherius]|uniref:Uncharacterized protein n=1 Tax=Deinococcus aetherius TaxID=200252 RepID=A0ABN6RR69_9DEIO|nr:hypothetical protein [Deinococcus aetherius]BDP44336.1 hypothetical protein DAETH_43050 [Deinococcus aetherius]
MARVTRQGGKRLQLGGREAVFLRDHQDAQPGGRARVEVEHHARHGARREGLRAVQHRHPARREKARR